MKVVYRFKREKNNGKLGGSSEWSLDCRGFECLRVLIYLVGNGIFNL